MKALFSSVFFIITLSGFSQQINTENLTPAVNTNVTYTFTDDRFFATPNWQVTHGSIVSSTTSGNTYSAVIKFSEPGQVTISFRNGTSVIATLPVSVACPFVKAPNATFTYSSTCGSTTITRSGTPPTSALWYWQTSSQGENMSNSTASYQALMKGEFYLRAKHVTYQCWSQAIATSNAEVKLIPTAAAENQSICSEQSTSIAITNPNEVLGTTYTYVPTSANTTGALSGSGASISQPLSLINGASDGIVTYAITPTANGCTGNTINATATVKPIPVITSSLNPPGPPNCSTFSYIPTSSVFKSTFNWSRGAVLGIAEGANSGSNTLTITETLTNTTINPIDVNYSISATVNGCSGPASTVRVTIMPKPFITSSINPPPVQSGSTFSYTPSSSISESTFNWSRAEVTGIIEQASSGNESVNEVLTNTTSNPIDVTYLFSVTANGCTGPSASIIVTVNPIRNNYNYIISRDLQSDRKADGSVITEVDVASLPVQLKAENTTYFDGLGRPMQTVSTQASPSPSKLDIVTPIVYDQFGREKFKFLPIATGSDGYYKPNESIVDPVNGGYINAAASFYGRDNSTIASDSRPFSETVFEPSPLNRPAIQFGAGLAWKDHRDPNNRIEKPIIRNYLTNGLSEVYLFRYDATTSLINWAGANSTAGFYDAGELYTNKTTDEQGHEVIEYVDKEGRTVCKKVEASGSGNSKVYASTYYIYDNLGNLAVVLPPEGLKELTK